MCRRNKHCDPNCPECERQHQERVTMSHEKYYQYTPVDQNKNVGAVARDFWKDFFNSKESKQSHNVYKFHGHPENSQSQSSANFPAQVTQSGCNFSTQPGVNYSNETAQQNVQEGFYAHHQQGPTFGYHFFGQQQQQPNGYHFRKWHHHRHNRLNDLNKHCHEEFQHRRQGFYEFYDDFKY